MTLRSVGRGLLLLLAAVAVAAPLLAPNDPNQLFADRVYAPPSRVHLRDESGFRAPFVYRQTLDNRLLRTYRNDRAAPVALSWFSGGRVVTAGGGDGSLLVLGADALGRDIFSRLLYGARWSLGVAALGALVGGMAGTFGGRTDSVLMTTADFLLVLPGAYLVLVLRAALPLVLSRGEVFWLMALLFSAAGWPHVARGVRAIVATERQRDYAEAARAAGAGRFRLMRQLVPASRGFLAVEAVLLVPALLVAEATVSYLGLGFPEPTPSWGTMLQDAANVGLLVDAPWMLAPAAALFVAVLAVHLAGGSHAPERALLTGRLTSSHS